MNYFRNLEAPQIWEKLLDNGKVALLGSGGTGKSYNIRKLVEIAYENEYEVIITASTGIAARNLDSSGRTINSALKYQICANIEEYDNKKYLKYQKLAIKQNRTLLVIDEISMVSKEQLDLIFHILSLRNLTPLILIVGDFLQLVPVVKSGEPNFAFESDHFKEFDIVELTGNKRNSDDAFNIFLNRLRKGIYTHHDKAWLKTYAKSSKEVSEYTILDSRNADVEALNSKILTTLPGDEYYSIGQFVKSKDYENLLKQDEWDKMEEDLKKSIITPHVLSLKVGARVIITKNNSQAGYVNGDTGHIVGIYKGLDDLISEVTIELDNTPMQMTIAPVEFELSHPTDTDKSGKPIKIASYWAIPLKLAWAITTSKSQGMSIKSVMVKPENFFLAAEAYVAFSRCGETLVLDNFDFGYRVKAHPKALAFYENLEKYNSNIKTVSVDELDDIL